MEIIKYSPQEAAKKWTKISTYDNNMLAAWQKECMSNRMFYEGEQYSPEEKEILAARGQYDIVINKIRKAIKGMVGLVSSSIPKYKLVAIGDHDDKKAALGNKILDWCWENSGGLYTYASAVKSSLIDNMSYLHVILSKNNRVKFVKLGFDEVLVDPQSRHPLFDDAEMIIIRKYVPISYVKQVYGIDDLVSEIPNSFYAEPVANRGDNFLHKVFDSTRQYVNLYECYSKTIDGIMKETLIGYQHAFKEMLPQHITEYPIIPIYVEGYDNPYKRGEVHFLKTIQKFINKTYGVTILNAQLMSNPKMIFRSIDIPRGNIDEFLENLNTPGSATILEGEAQPPFIINGQPLNNAFFSLYADAKQEFEWLTIPNQILGYGDIQREGKSDLLDIKEGAIESLKEFIMVMELACSRLGFVMLQYVQSYIDNETVINITDNAGRVESVTLNKKEGLDPDNEESVRQWIQQQEQQEVPDSEIEAKLTQAIEDGEYVKELTYIMNETDFTNFDVRVVAGSYSPTYQMAMLRLMMELAQIGAVDPSVVLEHAPVEDRQKLMQRFDTINQLNGELNDREEEIALLHKELERVQMQLSDQRVTNITDKADLKMQKLLNDAKIKTMRSKFQDQLMTKEKMIELEKIINNMILEAKHDIMKQRLKTERVMMEREESIEDKMIRTIFE